LRSLSLSEGCLSVSISLCPSHNFSLVVCCFYLFAHSLCVHLTTQLWSPLQVDGSWATIRNSYWCLVPVSYRTKMDPTTLILDWVVVNREKHLTLKSGEKIWIRPGLTIASNQFEGWCTKTLFANDSPLVKFHWPRCVYPLLCLTVCCSRSVLFDLVLNPSRTVPMILHLSGVEDEGSRFLSRRHHRWRLEAGWTAGQYWCRQFLGERKLPHDESNSLSHSIRSLVVH
jgi:hypothetical protein